MNELIQIQSTLRPECHVSVKHDEYGGWSAIIETTRNHFPHWVRYSADTPDDALRKLSGFLLGTVPDHASTKRAPEVFMSVKS